MSEQSSSSAQQQAMLQLFDHVIALKKQGLDDKTIRRRLQESGIPAEAADMLLRKLNQAIGGQFRRVGLRDMGIGLAILVVGIAATAGTFALAADSGGTRFIVAYGAMGVGALQFLRGLYRFVRGVGMWD